MDTQDRADFSCWTNSRLLVLALLVRLFFILYARVHDYLFHLNFTDIDYDVFTDAAFLVTQGKSPYHKSTYRYTPLIAWMLVPNSIFADFGKLLFCVVDILVGWLQLHILESEILADCNIDAPKELTGYAQKHQRQQFGPGRQLTTTTQTRGFGRAAVICLWLFNPFNAIIAARGNSDSFICLLILLTLFIINKSREHKDSQFLVCLSAVVHGAGAIHLRLFPLIYLPSIFLHLLPSVSYQNKQRNIFAHFYAILTNKFGFLYCFVSLLSFSAITFAFYLLYGQPFLRSFLLYHLSRVDIKHNFSPYFLPFYLLMDRPDLVKIVGTIAYLPQIVCILTFAFRFSHDLPFCWFLTTFAFVTFNKVCTSQYFIWYLCFLPFVYVRVKLSLNYLVRLFALWFFGQACWLLPAYLLEFHCFNTFYWVWLASLQFMAINSYIIVKIVQAYSSKMPPMESKKMD